MRPISWPKCDPTPDGSSKVAEVKVIMWYFKLTNNQLCIVFHCFWCLLLQVVSRGYLARCGSLHPAPTWDRWLLIVACRDHEVCWVTSVFTITSFTLKCCYFNLHVQYWMSRAACFAPFFFFSASFRPEHGTSPLSGSPRPPCHATL